MRIRVLAVGAVVALVSLAGCTGHTSPPVSYVTATSAMIHGDVTWTQSDSNAGEQWRWEWSTSSDFSGTVLHNAYQAVPGCGTDPCSAHIDQNIGGLSPATRYYYRLAMTVNGSTFYGDSDGCCGSPAVYDSFATLSGYPSPGALAFDGDFDSGCQLTGSAQGAWPAIIGAYPQNPNGDHPGAISIASPAGGAGEGSCSAEASIPPVSQQADHTGRAAVQANPINMPTTQTWEGLYYLPSGANGMDHGALSQTKMGGTGGGCADGGLYVSTELNGQLSFNTRSACGANSILHGFGPTPAIRDQWFAVKTTETFADAGHVTVWYDDDGAGPDPYVQVRDFDADTLTASSGDNLKLDQGLYGDDQTVETHDFIDGFHLIAGS